MMLTVVGCCQTEEDCWNKIGYYWEGLMTMKWERIVWWKGLLKQTKGNAVGNGGDKGLRQWVERVGNNKNA